jgi:hypothetical protein
MTVKTAEVVSPKVGRQTGHNSEHIAELQGSAGVTSAEFTSNQSATRRWGYGRL